MCSRSTAERDRGTSLLEALVSLLVLTMVLIVALTLLFTMRSFADRQQVKTSARQTSRHAIDYLGSIVAGATDLNDSAVPPSPNALVNFYARGAANVAVQASWNDLPVGSAFGEPGTDILTLALPTDPVRVPFTKWPGKLHASTAWLDYREGCPSDADLERNFLALTGARGTGGSAKSGVLTVVDANGSWAYYQITGYQKFDCDSVNPATGLPDPVHVVANPGLSDGVNPPGGEPDLVEPVFLSAGMRFVSFRVRRDANGVPNLEQKQGLFDPATDNPGNAFTPVVAGVEDFQVAYLYGESPDGSGRTIFNTWDPEKEEAVVVPDVPGANNNGVPPQGTGSLWDISRVIGLRVSVTSRSAALRFKTRQISVRGGAETTTNARPRSEDRPGAGPDDFEQPAATSGARVGDFDHHRMTSTLLMRNRMLGS
jgi:hypothetical protein